MVGNKRKKRGQTTIHLANQKSIEGQVQKNEVKITSKIYNRKELDRLLEISREMGGRYFSKAVDFLNHIKKL